MKKLKKLLLISLFLQFIFCGEAKSRDLDLQFYCYESNNNWRLYAIEDEDEDFFLSLPIFLKNFYLDESFCRSVSDTLNEYYNRGYEYLIIGEEGFLYKEYFICMSITGPANRLRNCPTDRRVARIPNANNAEIIFRSFFQPYHRSADDYVETFLDFETSPNGIWPGMYIEEWLDSALEF